MNRPFAYDSPLTVYLEVTNACNLRCNHCYMSARSDEDEKLLTANEIYSLIDDLNYMNVFFFALAGGEPLLRKDFFDIAHYASDKDIQVFLTTNGTKMNEAAIKKLKEIGIEKVTVSLEGVTEHTHDALRGKGSFKKTMKGLKLLLQHGMNVETAITVCKYNIEEIPLIVQFCEENGVSGVQMNRLVTVGRGSHLREYTREECKKIGIMVSEMSENYRDYIEPNPSFEICRMKLEKCSSDVVAKTVCGTGFSFWCVLWNGDVTPCLLMRDVVFGNIKEQSLSEIWNTSPQLEAFRNAFKDPEADAVPPCSSCMYRDSCGRGCRAQAYHVYGTFADPEPICELWGG